MWFAEVLAFGTPVLAFRSARTVPPKTMPSHANKLSAKAVVTTHTRNTCVTKHTPVMRKTWTNGRPSRVSAAAFATTAFATTAVATHTPNGHHPSTVPRSVAFQAHGDSYFKHS